MSLKCPRTGSDLKEIDIDGIKVDVSEKCGGVWFDNFEIKKFDEVHETAGDKLLEFLQEFQTEPVDHKERINCPKCSDVVLMRAYYSPRKQVEIDTCPKCAGIWLDPGELTCIQKMFATEAEKVAYVEEFANDVSEKSLEKLTKFAMPSVLMDQAKLNKKG